MLYPNDHSGRPHAGPERFDRGFTLVEVLIVIIVLGLLGAVVLPKFSDAAHHSRHNALKDDLRYLRMQIELFKAQHREVPPGYPDGRTSAPPTAEAFLQQMTAMTDEKCRPATSAKRALGPYLETMPANAVNGLNTLLVVGDRDPLPAPDGSTGWIYKPRTMEIIPNLPGKDDRGTRYIDY